VRVKVDFGDGTEEEIDVYDGSMHFHPYEDGEKHDVTVTPLEADPEAEDGAQFWESVGAEEFDPGEHTVAEVQEYVTANPDRLDEVYLAELDGKARSTLTAWLEERIPFDPGSYTVQEVVDYAIANPRDLESIISDEQAGKNRSTLISQLQALHPA
jgi:hypothetical protein